MSFINSFEDLDEPKVDKYSLDYRTGYQEGSMELERVRAAAGRTAHALTEADNRADQAEAECKRLTRVGQQRETRALSQAQDWRNSYEQMKIKFDKLKVALELLNTYAQGNDA